MPIRFQEVKKEKSYLYSFSAVDFTMKELDDWLVLFFFFVCFCACVGGFGVLVFCLWICGVLKCSVLDTLIFLNLQTSRTWSVPINATTYEFRKGEYWIWKQLKLTAFQIIPYYQPKYQKANRLILMAFFYSKLTQPSKKKISFIRKFTNLSID